jgi:hypothetical protein
MVSNQLTLGVRIAAIVLLLSGTHSAFAQETNPVKLLRGTISNSQTGKPIDDGGKVYAFTSASATEPATSSKINPKTGAYQLILSPSTQYRLVVKSPSFETGEFPYTSPAGSNYEESQKDMAVKPIAVGSVIYAGRLFEPNSAAYINDPYFQKVLDMLRTKQSVMVSIDVVPDGIFDAPKAAPKPKKPKKGAPVEPAVASPTTGGPQQELAELGTARVQAIKDLLKQQKISITRVKINLRPARQITRPAKGKLPKLENNVELKITGVSAQEDDEES